MPDEGLESASMVGLVELVGFVRGARGAHPRDVRSWGYAREKTPHKPHQLHHSGLNNVMSEYREWWSCLRTGLKLHHFRPSRRFLGGFLVHRRCLGRN